jgi:hypothetical protein
MATLEVAARTTTPVNGTGVDTNGYRGVAALLSIGTVSGTSPTLSLKLQESDDNSAWSDITGAVSSTFTTANQHQLIDVPMGGRANRKRYVRGVLTIGGTTPSFTCGAEILLYDPAVEPVVNSSASVVVNP